MKCLFGLCGGISWANVGHSGGTPVQRACSATWMLPPVKMATVCVCLVLGTHTILSVCGGCGRWGA